MNKKILLIGVTGVFGNRLIRHLTGWNDIELIASSRSLARADRAVDQIRQWKPDATLSAVAFDTSSDIKNQLDVIRPFCVIDCSGPFQGAGHKTAKAILEAGCHLIDLADARDYLQAYNSKLDDVAKNNGVAGITGASSTPTLSSVVVDQITQDWQRVDTIDICITPGGKSEVGRSVLEAILSYAGRKIPIWDEGKLSNTHGWLNGKSTFIPGLGKRRIAPVETIDAELMGKRYKVTSRVSFYAGLESRLEQFGIGLIALLVKFRFLKNAKPLASMLLRLRKITRILTGDTGAMKVTVRGIAKDGVLTIADWILLAKHDHGPFVPVLPAAASLRALLDGKILPSAGFAFEHLSLNSIEKEMDSHTISTTTNIERISSGVFSEFLGTKRYEKLPSIVQKFHHPKAPPVWAGEAEVAMSRNILLAIIGNILGFPKSGKAVPICVTVDRKVSCDISERYSETWTRNFADRCFSSTLESHENGRFTEKFGPLTFDIGLDVDDGKLVMPVAGWKFGFMPMPRFLAPVSQAVECEDEFGRFQFDVKLTMPLLGLFAHYRGWLMPKLSSES